MSDNVYTVNPGLNGLIPKPNKDTPEEEKSQARSAFAFPTVAEELQIAMHDENETYIHFQADCPDYREWHEKVCLRAYRLGAADERYALSEAVNEYLGTGDPTDILHEYDQRCLDAFLEWHLSE